jgi:dienelactone hydrolase
VFTAKDMITGQSIGQRWWRAAAVVTMAGALTLTGCAKNTETGGAGEAGSTKATTEVTAKKVDEIAATLPAFAASCDFYGARVSSLRPGGGPPSLQLVPRIPGRLWCFCGDADPLMPAEERSAIAAALTAANGGIPATDPAARHRLITAPGAGHGYLCEARADFQPDGSRAGWAAMLGLFAENL